MPDQRPVFQRVQPSDRGWVAPGGGHGTRAKGRTFAEQENDIAFLQEASPRYAAANRSRSVRADDRRVRDDRDTRKGTAAGGTCPELLQAFESSRS